ncbi:MAG: acyl carrier protein [Oscillatoriales cyanobacterium RM1_1_9]|nr:acyl carrier protein [Oscillatoriales cyanobacterium SM2_3_0]NJO44526.1 acyl carrier protein [Oscillatoriales cyanobacterium RM2_1_1]NJO70669.1 acyl carrier protein [Oscillatoriales cyanobacterium RM1_1_9]
MQLLNQSLNGKEAPRPLIVDYEKSPLNILAATQTVETIRHWLISQLATRLGLQPEEINVHEDFTHYGLNSIEAVNLSGDLESVLGRRLPPTILWDYPNIQALAAYLAEDTSKDAGVFGNQGRIAPEIAEQLLGKLDQLSDVEVDALLQSFLFEEEND